MYRPIYIDTFLAELAAKRRAEQARARTALQLSPNFRLPRELELAIKYGWFLQPVFARSTYAGRSARTGVPDNSREQIEYWAATYSDCNWELTVGRDSDVMAIEVDMQVAQESLSALGGDDLSAFERTLRYEAGARRSVALFHYAGKICRCALPGIRVLSDGETLLVPPSRLSRDVELSYADPFAAPGDPPKRLFEPVTIGERYAKIA